MPKPIRLRVHVDVRYGAPLAEVTSTGVPHISMLTQRYQYTKDNGVQDLLSTWKCQDSLLTFSEIHSCLGRNVE